MQSVRRTGGHDQRGNESVLPKAVPDTETVEEINTMVADSITVSRILFSLLLLAFTPNSYPFAVVYLLCGITDVLDGFVARKLHTESEKGARLDSIADLVFAVVYAVRILPLLSVPYWIWLWTAVIAVIKIAGIVIASRKAKRMTIEHSLGNRLTGLLLFLLPLSVHIADVKYTVAVVCIVATVTAIKEIVNPKLH